MRGTSLLIEVRMSKSSILPKIALGAGVLVAALVGVIAMQPAEFKVQRSTSVSAPPDVVFSHINDFHQWEAWSPWAKIDPQMKTTYTGPETGVGAAYAWDGNDEVGSGKMTIKGSTPPAEVVIDLHFLTPFEAENITTFTVSPEGEGSKVVWAMTGHNNFMSKAFGLVMPMDKMVGGDFEKGLAAMKQVTEADAKRLAEEAAAAAAAAAAAVPAEGAPSEGATADAAVGSPPPAK